MDNSFFYYLQQLEVIAFFSGYPLVYFLVMSLAGQPSKRTGFRKQMVNLLPMAYALTGTLYLGLQIRNLFPDFSYSRLLELLDYPFWRVWALLAVLFWLPVLQKKSIVSLLHSVPFFLLLIKNIFIPDGSVVNTPDPKNEMKVYTDSLLVNAATLFFLLIVYYLIIQQIKKARNSSHKT